MKITILPSLVYSLPFLQTPAKLWVAYEEHLLKKKSVVSNMEECPICADSLQGSIVSLGCCKKMIHLECIIKCMKLKLDCPMCRYRHESLRIVHDPESQILVTIDTQFRNRNFFRTVFIGTTGITLLALSMWSYSK